MSDEDYDGPGPFTEWMGRQAPGSLMGYDPGDVYRAWLLCTDALAKKRPGDDRAFLSITIADLDRILGAKEGEQAMKVNWQARLSEAMGEAGDDGPVTHCFPGREEFWELFEGDAYVGSGGKRVIAWTEKRVYFSVADDCGGYRWLDSAPRNPPETNDQPRIGSW